MNEITDEIIVDMYWSRDEQAIRMSEEKYGKYCASIAERILADVQDVEECVSDVYLKAWNSIPPKKPEVLRTFLGKLTRNAAFDRYRRTSARKRGKGEIPLVVEELEECIAGGSEPEKQLEEKELRSVLNAFLGNLPKAKRVLFLRRYWYADSVTNIAKRYSMTPGAVSTSLHRMREDLKKYLTERGVLL